jgi:hypothetical protein
MTRPKSSLSIWGFQLWVIGALNRYLGREGFYVALSWVNGI